MVAILKFCFSKIVPVINYYILPTKRMYTNSGQSWTGSSDFHGLNSFNYGWKQLLKKINHT